MPHRIFLPPVIAGLLFFFPPAGAEEFVWKHVPGDRYRIISTVREDVHVNGEFSHHAEILNRIAVTVESLREGRARHSAVFLTAEEAVFERPSGGVPGENTPPGEARVFSWSREYTSVFERDSRGRMTIGNEYFMPVVRNVPVFPEGDLRPGDTWTADGHEAHDFRESLGMTGPYLVPFTARYQYLGMREWNGREYPAIAVSYQIDRSSPSRQGGLSLTRMRGNSEEILYWDPDLGQARYYTETFSARLELSNGYVLEFAGTAEAELVESPDMDREGIAGEIARELSEQGVEGAEVRTSGSGVTIVLEDIRFDSDSAALLPAEREKLDRVAAILRRYPERDVLVAGHTALAGSAGGREQLSLERAASVAEYLVAGRVRPRDRIFIRGFGASQPRADNRSEAGRRQNRRVEITILEN